jgi:hypothetical protein
MYYCRATIDADFAATEAFYFTQLTGTPGRSAPKESFKMGTLKNGREVMIQVQGKGKAPKAGTDRIEVAVQLYW